jgi:hypothetical protein
MVAGATVLSFRRREDAQRATVPMQQIRNNAVVNMGLRAGASQAMPWNNLIFSRSFESVRRVT